jgi:phospholipase/lecithinase/hemolysin
MLPKRTVGMVLACALVLLGLAAPAIGARGGYARLVVFGDSLSDPGNAAVLTREVEVPPFDLIPDAPYARGGLHFSNGETWAEQLAAALRLKVSAGPALRVPGVFSNYAVGTARARAVGPFDLTTQVTLFLEDFGGQTPADALYVVFVGNNDVRDALDALAIDPSGATSFAILGEALGAIQQGILTLATAGARNFLVANVPDLSLVPAVILAGAAAQGAALVLATNFNSGLATVLLGLEGAIPGIRIAALDTFGLLRELVGPPSVFGNVSDPCITPGTRVSPYCTRPDVYLFWDGIHPTRVGHGAVAQRALETLLQQ